MKDRKLYVMVIFFIIVVFFCGILIQQLIEHSHRQKQNEEIKEEQEIPKEENEGVQKPSIEEESNTSNSNIDSGNNTNVENNKEQEVLKPNDNNQNSTSSSNNTVGNNTNKEQEVQKPNDNNQNNTLSSNDKVNNENKEQVEQTPIVDNEINSSGDQSSSNNTNNDNSNVENNEEQEVSTQEEINNTYRNQLQNKYGIKITYGNEMGNYSATGANLTKMTDPNTISEYLKKVDSVLSLYPSGFFKEIINFNMPLTIYLVEAVANGQYAGLLDSQFMNDIKLTIKKDGLFERTLHHELFHYVDAYLSVKMYPDNVEYSWKNLNPSGYSYGTVIASYTFNMVTNAPGAYFINDYSQTNYREDRATLFADMMTRVLKKKYMNEGEPILIKMRRIAEELDTYFATVNSTNKECWERLIY